MKNKRPADDTSHHKKQKTSLSFWVSSSNSTKSFSSVASINEYVQRDSECLDQLRDGSLDQSIINYFVDPTTVFTVDDFYALISNNYILERVRTNQNILDSILRRLPYNKQTQLMYALYGDYLESYFRSLSPPLAEKHIDDLIEASQGSFSKYKGSEDCFKALYNLYINSEKDDPIHSILVRKFSLLAQKHIEFARLLLKPDQKYILDQLSDEELKDIAVAHTEFAMWLTENKEYLNKLGGGFLSSIAEEHVEFMQWLMQKNNFYYLHLITEEPDYLTALTESSPEFLHWVMQKEDCPYWEYLDDEMLYFIATASEEFALWLLEDEPYLIQFTKDQIIRLAKDHSKFAEKLFEKKYILHFASLTFQEIVDIAKYQPCFAHLFCLEGNKQFLAQCNFKDFTEIARYDKQFTHWALMTINEYHIPKRIAKIDDIGVYQYEYVVWLMKPNQRAYLYHFSNDQLYNIALRHRPFAEWLTKTSQHIYLDKLTGFDLAILASTNINFCVWLFKPEQSMLLARVPKSSSLFKGNYLHPDNYNNAKSIEHFVENNTDERFKEVKSMIHTSQEAISDFMHHIEFVRQLSNENRLSPGS